MRPEILGLTLWESGLCCIGWSIWLYSAPSPETYFIALTLTFLPNTLLCFKIKLPCFEFGEKNKEHVLHICTLCNNGCVWCAFWPQKCLNLRCRTIKCTTLTSSGFYFKVAIANKSGILIIFGDTPFTLS